MYKKRYERAQGYAISCQAMCTEISLGHQLYAISKLLHQAIFINGTMTSIETWPNFNINRIEMFERVEQSFFRRILNAHSKTPIESIYLEMGVIPFRFLLMSRRIAYFYQIMGRADDEITKRVVLHQKFFIDKKNNDFYWQTISNMEELNITEAEVLSSPNIDLLKDKLEKKVKHRAFEFLIELSQTHSKVRSEIYKDVDGKKYFNDPKFTPDLSNLIFKLRTRMFDVRNNFRNNYIRSNTLCPLCCSAEDSQEHLMECHFITNNYNNNKNCIYDDIFSDDNDKLYNIAILMKEAIEIRNTLIETVTGTEKKKQKRATSI